MKREEAYKILNLLTELHPTAGCELNFSSPFELLIATILSAQCTDIRVNIITEKLFKVYNTPEDFAALKLEELKPYIFSCGFFNNKGTSIINCSQILVKEYNSKVPQTLEELIMLPGVGRKTASVVLSVAFNIPAMPVDTHVFRVSNRIGFSNGNNVDKVEQSLKKLFYNEDWNRVHHTLIFHGRYVCKSRSPLCIECNIKDKCKEYKKIGEKCI